MAAEHRVPKDIEGAFDPPETHRNLVDMGAQILDFRSYGVIRRGDSNKDGDAGPYVNQWQQKAEPGGTRKPLQEVRFHLV